MLQVSDGIDNFGRPVWQIAVSLLVCWTIVTLVLLRGASSFGKAAYFTAIFPYIMLTVMLVQGATLEGSLDGILYFIVPDWSKLLDPIVWYAISLLINRIFANYGPIFAFFRTTNKIC